MNKHTDFEQTAVSSGNAYDDDKSMLQPGSVTDIDINEGVYLDEEAPSTVEHDQLPSPEEYKAKMKDIGMCFQQDRTSSSSSDNNKNSRVGLYTFLGLLLVMVIFTSILVPLVLNNKQDQDLGLNTSQANTGSSTNGGSYSGSTTTTSGSTAGSSSSSSGTTSSSNSNSNSIDYYPPIVPSSLPPASSDSPTRLEQTLNYLVSSGAANSEDFEGADSTQRKAAYWIAIEDQFQMDIPTITTSDIGIVTHTRFIERWTLAIFYYSTGGATWKNNVNFMQPIDHCDWYELFIDGTGSFVKMGVTQCGVGNEDFMVKKMELSNNVLVGSLPKEIQHLHFLSDLILPFNAGLIENSSLNGLVSLSSLNHLELQYCGITGTIPADIGNLGSLTYLGLGNNFLTGTIPESFFQLSNLIACFLDDNSLQSKIAPFAKLTNMEKLYIEDNAISGEITEDMISDGWQKMIDLDVSGNKLAGPIPANIWSMSNLEVMDLHGNNFVGTIPVIESVHDKMMFIAVQDNALDWKIPESINNLVNLAHLDVSANNMVLPFPSTMNQLKNLQSLYTGMNSFEEHPVPSFLMGMTNLKELSMKQNKLTGTIPIFLGGLTNLKVLDLDFNKLEGSIPSELGTLTEINTMMLNRNYLNGTLPDSFSSLEVVDILLLDGNNLIGSADVICKDNTINPSFFSADCGEPDAEIECSCCHLCCNDNNAICNNFDWRTNLDAIWEYDFQRVVYSSSQNLLPSDAKVDYAQPEDDNDDSM